MADRLFAEPEARVLRFEVPGNPHALARHRTTRNGLAYDPPENRSNKAALAWCAREAMKRNGISGLIEGAVVLDVRCVLARPKSVSPRRRPHPTTKPDWDNLGKLVCDALNGVAWRDDCQIVRATVVKVYGDEPRTEVEIREIVP